VTRQYMHDPDLSWGAVGLLTYLLDNQLDGFDNIDALTLNRAAYHWHPNDRGDFEVAWDELIATGYLYSSPEGERWWINDAAACHGDLSAGTYCADCGAYDPEEVA